TRIDDHTLEVEVSKDENLNAIFTRLSGLGIGVLSMRNKVNRLEEIFMQLVERRPPAASEDSPGNGGDPEATVAATASAGTVAAAEVRR
ncbi:MAG: hypothetical protein JOZ89_03940, partial [Gammaproteobacteria bacterium]|nr:hypothetical protein [Gammaproteobacteria bacterium]